MDTPTEQMKRVHKYVLQNGMTVLVCPKQHASQVAVQLWYNVGSKHEKDGEKGIAHFIEHMIFKGTTNLLSESDMTMLGQKLSAYTNAFTGWDYTAYVFTIPVANWDKVLEAMADSMENVAFKQEHMNSEVKAVIQELKMRNDMYSLSLFEELIISVFQVHPYHYPIIGYKSDLWSLTRDDMVAFYKKHYMPSNATMVIVGDVQPEDALKQVESYFGSISSAKAPEQEDFYRSQDIRTQSVRLYRDIKSPIGQAMYVVPGKKTGEGFVWDVIADVIGGGKSSRLYKRLVHEEKLVSTVNASVVDLFDAGLLVVEYTALSVDYIDRIFAIIQEEFDDIAKQGVKPLELRRAVKSAIIHKEHLLENVQEQATEIGSWYLATQDEEAVFEQTEMAAHEHFEKIIQDSVQAYCTVSSRHEGRVLPMQQNDVARWKDLQVLSDQEDARILDGKERHSDIEPGRYVHTVKLRPYKEFKAVIPQVIELDNGVSVMVHENDVVETVEIVCQYEGQSWRDPQGKEGLAYLANKMLLDGTQTLPGHAFMEQLESYGMRLSVAPGVITLSLLGEDIEQGLEFMRQLLIEVVFTQENLDKHKARVHADIDKMEEEPSFVASQAAKEAVYNNHPYSKRMQGTHESIDAISLSDVKTWYADVMTPKQARCAVVGKCTHKDMKGLLASSLGSWQGKDVVGINFPQLAPISKDPLHIELHRDQTYLVFAGVSIDRADKDFDALTLFDQVMCGGVLLSMTSYLFMLRERTGLFYTAGGSLALNADEQPGMMQVRTIVSNDKLQAAKEAFLNVFSVGSDRLTQEEVDEAKRVLIAAYAGLYDSNAKMAQAFLSMHRYGQSFDHYEKQVEKIAHITKEEIQAAAQRVLNMDHIKVITVGRSL